MPTQRALNPGVLARCIPRRSCWPCSGCFPMQQLASAPVASPDDDARAGARPWHFPPFPRERSASPLGTPAPRLRLSRRCEERLGQPISSGAVSPRRYTLLIAPQVLEMRDTARHGRMVAWPRRRSPSPIAASYTLLRAAGLMNGLRRRSEAHTLIRRKGETSIVRPL